MRPKATALEREGVVDGRVRLRGMEAHQLHQPAEDRAKDEIKEMSNSQFLHGKCKSFCFRIIARTARPETLEEWGPRSVAQQAQRLPNQREDG